MKSCIITALTALFIGTTMTCQPRIKGAPLTARVTYYTDAQGVFTLVPPAASMEYYLPLRGTCSLPALMLQVKKKKAGSLLRQIAYLMKGKQDFNFRYIFKDGAGEYDVIIYGKKTINTQNLNGLCSFTVRSDTDLPTDFSSLDISESILAYVNSVMGKTVGSGECWDLAQQALDVSGADWNRPFLFGMPLDPGRDRIRAGDIIQFKSVRLETRLENGGKIFNTIGAPDHTAIIIGVEGNKKYKLAHQNSDGKRYVITSTTDLNNMRSGKYWIYRPVAGIVE